MQLGYVWVYVFTGAWWDLSAEDKLYSFTCSCFFPFIFSVFLLEFRHWSSVFWPFLSFCLLVYVLFSGQFLDFIFEFFGEVLCFSIHTVYL